LKSIGIIGGGIVGLIAANKLSSAGYETTLFTYAPCASSVAPGVNSIKGLFRGDTPLFQEKILGHQRLWQELVDLEKSSGMDLELRKIILEPFKTRSELSVLGERAFHHRFLGLFGTQIVPRAASLAGLSPDLLGSIVHSHDYSYNTLKVLEALRKVFLSQEGIIIPKKVIGIEEEENSNCIHLNDGQTLRFDEIILAAGASTPFLLQASGIEVKGFRFKAGVGLEAKSSLRISLKRGQTSLNANGSVLRYGAKDFSVPLKLDYSKFQEDFAHEIEKNLLSLVENLKDLTHEFDSPRPLGGVRLDGPDRRPLVTRYSSEGKRGFIIASGFHKSGWSLAWSASDTILKLIP
jgi:glycine/D-amino acid oxidase-like deaminating enzyme